MTLFKINQTLEQKVVSTALGQRTVTITVQQAYKKVNIKLPFPSHSKLGLLFLSLVSPLVSLF